MKTFSEAIAARGLKEPKLHSPKYWNNRPIPKGIRAYPDEKEVLHRALVEAQGPDFTFAPQEPQDDAPVFSSPGLADWYVRRYCQLNRLKP